MTFGLLLQVVSARVAAMLVGPAGSGKSTAAEHLGEALGLGVDDQSCHSQMTSFELMGYMDAHGVYHSTALRRAFEHGGVFLLDEVDASNPEILVVINGLAAVGVGQSITWPDGARVARHPDFILICGANTFGDGASDEYVGRQQLDAATLDRFAAISWEYDEALERRVARHDEWVSFVQRVRQINADLNLSLLVTPRASINGANLLRAGIARRQVESMVVFKGASDDTVRTVRQALRDPSRP